ncbi:class I SAM-dependent methyltransferase [Caldithrix abyssi]|nr:class I SAM-dependent methyltransferase [Caldithrix abyssi]
MLNHFDSIKNIILESNEVGLVNQPKNISGFSENRLIGVLQRIAKYQEANNDYGCYLEIGVFQGMTLLSVANELSKHHAYGIDNFSQCDPSNTNKDLIRSLIQENQINNVHLINDDYERALDHLWEHIGDKKISTFFIDGPHDYRSQLMCLELAKKYYSKKVVIIVDDSNYSHVRMANWDFLKINSQFKLFFEAYTECHPENLNDVGIEIARKGRWNGVNIIVHDPENLLERRFPSTSDDRSFYVNGHIVHSEKLGIIAPRLFPFLTMHENLIFISHLPSLFRPC